MTESINSRPMLTDEWMSLYIGLKDMATRPFIVQISYLALCKINIQIKVSILHFVLLSKPIVYRTVLQWVRSMAITGLHFSQTVPEIPYFSPTDLHFSRGLTVHQICLIRAMLTVSLNSSFGPSTHISHSRNRLSVKETQISLVRGHLGTRIQHKAKKQETTIEIRTESHSMLPKPTMAMPHRLITKKIRHQITRMSINNMRMTTIMTLFTVMQAPMRTFGPMKYLPKATMSRKSLTTLLKHIS